MHAPLNKPPESWTDEDADAARGRAARVCQLRHVESMHFDRRGQERRPEGTALRVGVTRADGEDVSKVVHVDADTIDAVDAVVERALREIEGRFGVAGREPLLARMAEAVLVHQTEQNASKRGEPTLGTANMGTAVRAPESTDGKTA